MAVTPAMPPPIRRREEIALGGLTPELLAGLEDDVLYVFGASADPALSSAR
jgi:hypothetical protein